MLSMPPATTGGIGLSGPGPMARTSAAAMNLARLPKSRRLVIGSYAGIAHHPDFRVGCVET
jgi:hypothetical protein